MLTKKKSSKVLSLPTRAVGDIKHVGSFAIYGRPGSGKTTLASSFPKPLLLLDIGDRGTESIADVKGIDVMDIECMEDLEDVYYFLKANDHKYKTIVFDTVTNLQKVIMKDVAASAKKDTSKVGNWGTLRKQDWGTVGGVLSKWITDFRDLPMETVFLSQERVSNSGDEEDGGDKIEPSVGPAVMPSVATTLNAAVNVVANMFIKMKRSRKVVKGKKLLFEEPVYCLGLGPHAIYARKIRKPKSGDAPDYLEDPTYDDLMSLIKGE
jgi:phage nucleotide-binding protein